MNLYKPPLYHAWVNWMSIACDNSSTCPPDHVCAYTPKGAGGATLLYDGSATGYCAPLKEQAINMHPPCSTPDSCIGGSCSQIFPNEGTRRCTFNLTVGMEQQPSAAESLRAMGFPWGDLWLPSYIPSTYCADAFTTNFSYTSPGNVACWVAMETLSLPVTSYINEIFSWNPFLEMFAFASEQILLNILWNERGGGAWCTQNLDRAIGFKEMSNQEQIKFYNDALDMCEGKLGFKHSDRIAVPPDPNPPPAPVIEYPDPCENKTVGQVCTNGLVSGTCQPIGEYGHGTPSPTGNVCEPLDLPQCSILADVASPPRGCEDRPYFYESTSSPDRMACALLKDQQGVLPPQHAWQCHTPTRNCPRGTIPCYWDGNWKNA